MVNFLVDESERSPTYIIVSLMIIKKIGTVIISVLHICGAFR
ncbi:hypothetical protein [Hydrocoleum sp. CS-953]|nr:hypothetical protein [Hydrocoleum sp. CS-953]